jgi:segregation and condensation protein A
LPRQEREFFTAVVGSDEMVFEKALPDVHIKDLMLALADVLKRAELTASHHIKLDTISVRDRMSHILAQLQGEEFGVFSTMFTLEEGRIGIVVTFLAMLELLKHNLIEFVQAVPFGPIHLKAAA